MIKGQLTTQISQRTHREHSENTQRIHRKQSNNTQRALTNTVGNTCYISLFFNLFECKGKIIQVSAFFSFFKNCDCVILFICLFYVSVVIYLYICPSVFPFPNMSVTSLPWTDFPCLSQKPKISSLLIIQILGHDD